LPFPLPVLPLILGDFMVLYSTFRFCFKDLFKSNGDEIQLTFSKLELGNYITGKWKAHRNNTMDSEI
jgi:hypothetical protein